VALIIRFVMPPLADATNSLASSNDTVNADFDHVIAISAVTMQSSTAVDVWVKNVGSAPIGELSLMQVEFGRESNPVPYAYGVPGCGAPCWWYEIGGESWGTGETLTIHIELAEASEPGALYRARVHGPRGGQAAETVRAR
jgi:hypothetical protein